MSKARGRVLVQSLGSGREGLECMLSGQAFVADAGSSDRTLNPEPLVLGLRFEIGRLKVKLHKV